MNDDPFRRFLGVGEMSDPRTLLGLDAKEKDRVRIETALRDRLDLVYRHPDGRSPEAERVRLRLRKAAAHLLGSGRPTAGPARGAFRGGVAAARPPAPRVAAVPRSPAFAAFTEFDRKVLAVLVGCGGWNARSRARLVGLAGAYGVAPHGLITVVRGLSDYARAGGPRLGVAEIGPAASAIAAGDARLASMPGASPVGSVLERIASTDWVPELKDESIGATIKLSMFFGLVAVLAITLFVRGLIVDNASDVLPSASPPPARSGPVSTPPPTRGVGEPPDEVRVARFQPLPTFLGNALPMQSTAAADGAPGVEEEIDLITRKLSITDEPSDAVYRSWAVAINTISVGWVLIDHSTQRAIERAIDDALHEATSAPSKGDRLIEAFVPPSGRLAEPEDVWRGAWQAGTLARITGQSGLPTAVVEKARRLLAVTMSDRPEDGENFLSGASAWLDQTVEHLVESTELDERTFDFWEMWLAAQRALGGGERRQRALLGAATRILASSTDLSRPGPSVRVLGRLLTDADLQGSAAVREATLALFDSRGVVSDHDLWVLTSLLAQLDTAPWFGVDLVLPDEAGLAFRNRIRDRIADRWPPLLESTGPDGAVARGLQIDMRAGVTWRRALSRLERLPAPGSDATSMERLILAARLNEAALLLAGRQRAQAETRIDDVEATIAELALRSRSAGGVSPVLVGAGFSAPSRGQATGIDGEWAEAYADARRNTSEKLKWLRALQNQAGTDLGPLDAEVFVREVYHGSPQEVRSVARSIVTDQFSDGAEVAMEMLDQFPDAPRTNREIADLIRRLTGRLLPSSRSETWVPEARLALVQHALSLRRNRSNLIDDLAIMLHENYVDRAGLLDRTATAGMTVRTPQAAAAHLADAWRDRARGAIARRAVPDDLPGLGRRRTTRRRLAQGPVQLVVAEQITMLDYHAYVTVAEQPALEESVLTLLAASAVRRRDANHLLAQATEAEIAMARLWALRMALPDEEGDTP